jgi:hypothetical protein
MTLSLYNRWVSRCLAKNALLKEEDDRYNEEMMGQAAEYTIQDSYVLKGQGGGGVAAIKKKHF